MSQNTCGNCKHDSHYDRRGQLPCRVWNCKCKEYKPLSSEGVRKK